MRRPTPVTARHPEVYEPAEDSFLFLDALEKEYVLLAHRKQWPCVVVEIGPGSGVLGAFLLQMLESPCLLLAIDVNCNAAVTAAQTYKMNNVKSAEPIVASLFHALRTTQVADIVLFNPPYVETPQDEVGSNGIEAAWAGGKDGLEVILAFIRQLPSRMALDGVAYLVRIAGNAVSTAAASGEAQSDYGIRQSPATCRN